MQSSYGSRRQEDTRVSYGLMQAMADEARKPAILCTAADPSSSQAPGITVHPSMAHVGTTNNMGPTSVQYEDSYGLAPEVLNSPQNTNAFGSPIRQDANSVYRSNPHNASGTSMQRSYGSSQRRNWHSPEQHARSDQPMQPQNNHQQYQAATQEQQQHQVASDNYVQGLTTDLQQQLKLQSQYPQMQPHQQGNSYGLGQELKQVQEAPMQQPKQPPQQQQQQQQQRQLPQPSMQQQQANAQQPPPASASQPQALAAPQASAPQAQAPAPAQAHHATAAPAHPQAQAVTAQAQGVASSAGKVVVDVRDVAQRFWQGVHPNRLAYVNHLATLAPQSKLATQPGRKLPPNVMPSVLQHKLVSGSNTLDAVLTPTPSADGMSFADFHYDAQGTLQPEASNVWQFNFELVKALNVGPSGFMKAGRVPIGTVGRVALFDKQHNRFLGNVHSMPTSDIRGKESTWLWDQARGRCVVRCCCVQEDAVGGTHVVDADRISLYVELNVAYKLTVEDTPVLPENEVQARQLVDELTTCWAMISLRRCAELGREMEISVPLYMGSIYDPTLLKKVFDEDRRLHPLRSFFTPERQPVLTFAAGPTPFRPQPLVAYSLMPPTMVCSRAVAYALASYRLCLAQALARSGNPTSPLADVVLASFKGIVQDSAVRAEFEQAWSVKCQEMAGPEGWLASCSEVQSLPTTTELMSAFKQCVLAVAPLLHCSSLPPRHISNFVEYNTHRSNVAAAYCHVIDAKTGRKKGRRPAVEPLSHAGAEFLHMPFDVAETRLCLGDQYMKAHWLTC
eukprot:jgi/Chrzof1/4494/Cz14g15130.t1